MKTFGKAHLLRTSLFAALSVTPGMFSGAFAQGTAAPAQPAQEEKEADVVVITGTMLVGSGAITTSPVTVVDQEELDTRGITTIQDAVQMLAANNGPAVTNSFAANGAFAAGASGASLRGLSTNSTLVLFDGLRAAYYPLADDGSRNFVDLNTIPDDIVGRVEVLKDGASSIYGADAIAGVVNIITKKEFEGFSARAETGVSDRGDAESNRFSVTAGWGDLTTQGVNAYISAFAYSSDQLKNSERPGFYGTDNLSTLCYQGTCGADGTLNALPASGQIALSTAANFMVAPRSTASTTRLGPYQNLTTDCGPGTSVSLTPTQQGTIAPASVCQYDYTNLYGVITPNISRFGLSGHAVAAIDDNTEAWAEANFIQSTVDYTGFPAVWRGAAPTGIYYPRYSSAANPNPALDPRSEILSLPVYVCPERVNCDTSVNGVLNPNNPFAASGQEALLIGRDVTRTTYNETQNRAYRAAGGITGKLFNGWDYKVDATAMHVDLTRTQDGYVYIQHMLDVIADGTYNFIDPTANSQDIIDYVMPTNIVKASSDLVQLQGSVTIPLMELAGGTAELAVGGSAMYEAVDAPSGNSDFNGATERYFTLNAFGTSGERRVYSAFFEVNAPVLDNLEVNAAGRFDDYSTGQSAFSPKLGVKYQPIDMLTLRATYSEGFRIPSFGEANALPTTGYVSNSAGLFNDTYLAQYGCTVATFSTCPTYIRSGSYGLTTLASPNLDPEESSSFNIGFVVEPISDLQISLDYYSIEKTGAITAPDSGTAIQAYYSGQPIDPIFTVIPDGVDPNNPTATPKIAFVESSLVNADTINAEGFDLNVAYGTDLFGLDFTSSLDVSYISKLSTTVGGVEQRYDGTLGNFNLTAGSGTPKWHGFWTNTVSVGDFDFAGTLNWFGGYNLSAMDQGTAYKDCGLSDGTVPCDVEDYFTFDLTGRYYTTENVTLYASIQNVFDELPPYDPVTYGAHLYNAVQGGNGILGRYFRVGVKFDY